MRDEAHQDIGRSLAQELDAARRSHLSANKKFDTVVGDVPSGLPHPDGVFRLEQAGKESRRALELYFTALRRYSDFCSATLCRRIRNLNCCQVDNHGLFRQSTKPLVLPSL